MPISVDSFSLKEYLNWLNTAGLFGFLINFNKTHSHRPKIFLKLFYNAIIATYRYNAVPGEIKLLFNKPFTILILVVGGLLYSSKFYIFDLITDPILLLIVLILIILFLPFKITYLFINIYYTIKRFITNDTHYFINSHPIYLRKYIKGILIFKFFLIFLGLFSIGCFIFNIFMDIEGVAKDLNLLIISIFSLLEIPIIFSVKLYFLNNYLIDYLEFDNYKENNFKGIIKTQNNGTEIAVPLSLFSENIHSQDKTYNSEDQKFNKNFAKGSLYGQPGINRIAAFFIVKSIGELSPNLPINDQCKIFKKIGTN